MSYKLKCIKCGKTHSEESNPNPGCTHSKYYGYLSYVYPNADLSEDKLLNLQSWGREVCKVLPLEGLDVSKYGGFTPLWDLSTLGSYLGLKSFYLKDESSNPTGSFKDRESLVVVKKAKEMGLKDLVVASSGNAAISTSFFAKRYGLNCTCYVSKHIDNKKLELLRAYCDRIHFFEGDYEDVYRIVIDESDASMGWNVTPGYNVVREEGIKLISFEIYLQTGVPDYIVVPCGNGTLLYGVYKAFKELKNLGVTDIVPIMVGVQVKGNDPLVRAWNQNKDSVKVAQLKESIVDGSILAKESFSSAKVMHALKETGGKLFSVSDEEVINGLRLLVEKESILPEIASASVVPGLIKLIRDVGEENIKDKKVVSVLSGSGLKDIRMISNLL